ncbi:MAG: metallophosphoesterase family protein [Bacillota bacterium]
MRLAILSDIHGNLVALNAVLDDLAGDRVDRFLCLGDVAMGGPQPRECLQRLRELDCTVVMGNTDHDLLHEPETGLPDWLAELVRWNQGLLTPEDRAYIGSFAPTVRLDLDEGVDLLAYHASPRSRTEFLRSITSAEELREMLGSERARVMAGGHTHQPMLRRFDQSLLINPGSVGLGWERRESLDRNIPWAEYALLSVRYGQPCVEFRRVPYDLDALRRATLAVEMVHAETWLSRWTTGSPARLPQ